MSLTDGVLARGIFGFTGDGNETCPNGSIWVWEGLRECAVDARDMASVYLGLFSILCFMVSSIPQYVSSCKTGNMDSALSIWFLLLWLGGDTCNLAGSILADQLPLQKYTAIYYVLADLVMLAMYFYYLARNSMVDRKTALRVMGVACVLGFTASLTPPSGPGPQQALMSAGFKSRSLLATSDDESLYKIQAFSTKEIIGFSIGSVSSVLYLCSRLPQMYTNWKRKSTEGVSYFLFALVILGNTTYGMSVMLKNPDPGQGEGSYMIHHLPWLIGSLGTLSLDLLISIQFLTYRKQPLELGRAAEDETTALLA